MNEYITIVRRIGNYGIDSKLTGYYLPDMIVLPKRVYHGRIVYIHSELPTHSKADGMGFKRTIK